MNTRENKRARFSAGAFWKSACVSAALVTVVACGGDDGGSDTPDPTPTKDASAGGKSDASTGGKADAGTGSKADAGTGSKGDAAAPTGTTGDATAGKAVAAKYICTSCHGQDYSGAGYFANITPDEDTGIGSWTDQQIKDAVLKGVDDEGNDLCAAMPRQAKLTTTEQNNLVAYLRSLDPVSNEIDDTCE